MAKTFVITLPDDLEQALTSQAERLNKSPEEIMLQVLSERLTHLDLKRYDKLKSSHFCN